MKRLPTLFLALVGFLASQAQPPAFPTAEGGGRHASGGRGGRVIKVTSLSDDGPGTLRQALREKGPRTVIFEVAGTIELKSPMIIREGNLTLRRHLHQGLPRTHRRRQRHRPLHALPHG